jgi:hypothetical protein
MHAECPARRGRQVFWENSVMSDNASYYTAISHNSLCKMFSSPLLCPSPLRCLVTKLSSAPSCPACLSSTTAAVIPGTLRFPCNKQPTKSPAQLGHQYCQPRINRVRGMSCTVQSATSAACAPQSNTNRERAPQDFRHSLCPNNQGLLSRLPKTQLPKAPGSTQHPIKGAPT